MNIILFTIVAALLYLFSDWALNRIEISVGKRFEHRSLIFFAILMTLALTTFTLIQVYTGNS